jgi:hypothetical protein
MTDVMSCLVLVGPFGTVAASVRVERVCARR